jgi:NodT family efflux transporter outer membrane factor (OMF) lipoprotein
MRANPVRILILWAPLLVLPGCTVHQARESYPSGVDVPSAYSYPGGEANRAGRWWESYGDPALDRTIATVLDENPTLMQAWARLEQARALARQASTYRYPEVTAGADASRSRTSFNVGGELGERNVTSDLFSLSAAATYEVDLWGRVRSLADAAEVTAMATREDLDTIAMTLAAQVAETWFGIAEQQSQLELLDEQIEVGRTLLKLVELRFSLGQAAAVDVYQQRLQLAATESQVPLAQARFSVLRNLLAALLGLPAGKAPLELPKALPALPPLPLTGLPVDLLRERPDVRATHLRIRAADHLLGAAIADLYPALRLRVAGGFQWRDIENVFDTWVYQLAAGLLGPLYDGGRRRDEIDRRRAIMTEMLQMYRASVLSALREVEDALVLEERQKDYLVDLQGQAGLSKATLERSIFRYGSGLSDYLPVVTALLSMQNIERTELSARRQLLSYRLQLHRALGGDWARSLRPPETGAQSQLSGDIP